MQKATCKCHQSMRIFKISYVLQWYLIVFQKNPVEILVLNDLYELDMLRISGFRFMLSGTVIDKCWHKSPVQYLE